MSVGDLLWPVHDRPVKCDVVRVIGEELPKGVGVPSFPSRVQTLKQSPDRTFSIVVVMGRL